MASTGLAPVQDIAGQIIAQGKVTNSHRAYPGLELATTTAGGQLVAQGPGDPAAGVGQG